MRLLFVLQAAFSFEVRGFDTLSVPMLSALLSSCTGKTIIPNSRSLLTCTKVGEPIKLLIVPVLNRLELAYSWNQKWAFRSTDTA
jgi:hypothetical protein